MVILIDKFDSYYDSYVPELDVLERASNFLLHYHLDSGDTQEGLADEGLQLFCTLSGICILERVRKRRTT